jgi:elongation factor P
MKIEGVDLRPGNVIQHEGRLWVVVKTQHVQPGKGGAFMQVELKSLREGTKKNERFRSSQSVERVFLDEQDFRFLYADHSGYVFMNPESYEQITVEEGLFSAPAAFLEEEMVVSIALHEGAPVWVKLPTQAVLEIEECEPSLKGQTATSSYKPAKMTNGLRVMVPPHASQGMKIVVNTEDSTYCERYKE